MGITYDDLLHGRLPKDPCASCSCTAMEVCVSCEAYFKFQRACEELTKLPPDVCSCAKSIISLESEIIRKKAMLEQSKKALSKAIDAHSKA